MPTPPRYGALGDRPNRLVVGYSMGAQQAFQWGALYSDMVRAIAPLCGSARTSPHNHLFLEGVKAALLADAAFADGWYQSPPIKGLRAFSRVYAGSIFVMDGRVWHQTGVNCTKDQTRAGLFAYYVRPFIRPQWNWSMTMKPEALAQMSPLMLEMLGFGSNVTSSLESLYLKRGKTAAT